MQHRCIIVALSLQNPPDAVPYPQSLIPIKSYRPSIRHWRHKRVHDVLDDPLGIRQATFMVCQAAFEFLKKTCVVRPMHKDRLQDAVRPTPKADAFRGFNTIANGQDHVKVVVFDHAIDCATTLGLNCRKFCDSCHPLQFLPQCVSDMLADCLDVSPEELRKMGAKAVGLDIDNTIVPDGTFNFLPGVREWAQSIISAGFPVMLISNGTLMRVLPASKHLGGVPFVHLSRKPSARGLLNAAKRMNVEISELAMLGDQLFSDIKAANKCGAIPVRIDPIPAKSLYPRYYRWKDKREKPILDEYEKMQNNNG